MNKKTFRLGLMRVDDIGYRILSISSTGNSAVAMDLRNGEVMTLSINDIQDKEVSKK